MNQSCGINQSTYRPPEISEAELNQLAQARMSRFQRQTVKWFVRLEDYVIGAAALAVAVVAIRLLVLYWPSGWVL